MMAEFPFEQLTGILDQLYREGAFHRVIESDSLFRPRLGEALGGRHWQDHLSPCADSLAQLLLNNVDFELRCNRYITDMMRFLSEINVSLQEPRERLNRDAAALAALQATFAGAEANVQRLKKLLLELPSQCNQMQRLMFRLNPPSFAAFCRKYEPLINRLRASCIDSEEVCVICLEKRVNVRILRSCGQGMCDEESNPVCHCKAQLCLDCLLHIYWTQSEQERKSYAPCPLCRSSFCLLDLAPLDTQQPAAKRAAPVRRTSKRLKRS